MLATDGTERYCLLCARRFPLAAEDIPDPLATARRARSGLDQTLSAMRDSLDSLELLGQRGAMQIAICQSAGIPISPPIERLVQMVNAKFARRRRGTRTGNRAPERQWCELCNMAFSERGLALHRRSKHPGADDAA